MERESDGIEEENRAENRRRRKWSSFGVESKMFEIGVDERKGKTQVIIMKSQRGVSSWVRLGPLSVEFFLESLNQCIKKEKKGKWERGWKENGRTYSLVQDENRVGCYLRLGVVDQEMRRFGIFIPKGRGERERWISMAEMLRKLGVNFGKKENKQEERAMVKPRMERLYAEMVKGSRDRDSKVVKVEVRGEEISKNLCKLEHCLVGSWNPSYTRGVDLERLEWLMANSWGLEGKLGLARLENGRILLEFEFVGEAKRVLSSGNRSVGGL